MKLIVKYLTSFLALWAQGTLGWVGIAKETTWGTPVAATDFFEIMSENISQSIDRFPVKNAYAGFHEPRDFAGLRRIGGDLSMFGHPLSLGHLLKAIMNTVSGSVVLSGFLFTNRFISTKSEFAYGVPSQPYTLEIHRDVGSSQQYAGMVATRLGLSLSPNQDLRVSAGWLGKSTLNIAKTTPTFPSSPLDPFAFDTCSVSIAGAANARFESLNLSIANNLNGIPALNAANTIARIQRGGDQQVRLSGTLDFPDITEYNDFVNQTERAFAFNLFRANSFNLFVELPSFIYTAFPLAIPGRDRLTVGFEGMAQYHTGSGTAISMALTNTKSNY